MGRYRTYHRISRKTEDEDIHPKVEIGKPGDKHEKEADDVANRVMMMPGKEEEKVTMKPKEEPGEVSMKPEDHKVKMQQEEPEEDKVNMQPEAGESEDKINMEAEDDDSVNMKTDDEEMVNTQANEDEGTIQEKIQQKSEDEEVKMKGSPGLPAPSSKPTGAGKNFASNSFASQLHGSKGSGKGLPDSTQQELGQKMGSDFSHVQIHTDSTADKMNKEIGAKAFTHKDHIYFRQGNYSPDTSKGKRLLAHELTHVIQQKGDVQAKVQRKNEGNDTAPFKGKLKRSLSIPFYSTKGKPNIKIILYHRPIECWRSTILSFHTIIDQADRTKRTIQTSGDENKELKTVLKYTMNNAVKHSFKISIDSGCPGPTQGHQLAVRGKIIRY